MDLIPGGEPYDEEDKIDVKEIYRNHTSFNWFGNKKLEHEDKVEHVQKLDLMEISQPNENESLSPRQEISNSTATTATTTTTSTIIEREHMFDKVVTPSDVGKLNRLVIPKQHAEKYFPLDSSTNEKGLLLNFEDRNGKPWRFRYSYWNSSQSYVMTKGWSRFVKEKKLDAGDIVSFQRGVGEAGKDRLFIDWRRRPDAPEMGSLISPTGGFPSLPYHHQHQFSLHQPVPWTPLVSRPGPATASAYPRDHFSNVHLNSHRNNNYGYGFGYGYGYGNISNGNNVGNFVVNPCGGTSGGSVIYLRPSNSVAPQHVMQMQRGGDGSSAVAEQPPVVFESVPVVQGKAAAKRLRLFGVNMECPIQDESVEECEILSSTSISHAHHVQVQHFHQFITSSSSSSPSSSSSHSHPQQLRLHKGTPVSTEFSTKGKASSSSSMSLDLDI